MLVYPGAQARATYGKSVPKSLRISGAIAHRRQLEKARRAGRIGGRPRLVIDRTNVAQMDADGLTQREIAAELGISEASVNRNASPGQHVK